MSDMDIIENTALPKILAYPKSREGYALPPAASDRYAIAFPLAIWLVSLFLPAIQLGQNEWLFPGSSPGLFAIIMSLIDFGLLLAELHKLYSNPGEVLVLAYFGCLWIPNLLMLAAPLFSPAVRKRKALAYLILLWTSFLLPLPLPFLIGKTDSRQALQYGYFVWVLSLFVMASIMTALYLQAPKVPANQGPRW